MSEDLRTSTTVDPSVAGALPGLPVSAVSGFLRGYGVTDPVVHQELAVVVADGNPWSRVRIDRLQTAVDAWFTSAMQGRLDTALPVHIAARAAFFLCSGPARWPNVVLSAGPLPADFRPAIVANVPIPTPTEARVTLPTADLTPIWAADRPLATLSTGWPDAGRPDAGRGAP